MFHTWNLKLRALTPRKTNVDRTYTLEPEYVAPNGRTDAAVLKW